MLAVGLQQAKNYSKKPCLLAKNLNDAKASRDLGKATCDRLISAIRDCEGQFYDETLERKKHLRVCSAWRREVAHQKLKSGLRLVISRLRPKEHWKRIFYGTRCFGGRHIKGRLINATHFVVEIMVMVCPTRLYRSIALII